MRSSCLDVDCRAGEENENAYDCVRLSVVYVPEKLGLLLDGTWIGSLSLRKERGLSSSAYEKLSYDSLL
jgi:hypothetical protein